MRLESISMTPTRFGEIGKCEIVLTGNEIDYINSYSMYGKEVTLTKDLTNTAKFSRFEVIFNKPTTILKYNGKTYISRPHNEEFDEEKGVLMCLVKALGISHSDLKRIIKNAKRQGENKCKK